MESKPTLQVGQTVWVLAPDYRVYNYRDKFRPYTVTGETSRSWIIVSDHGLNELKISKKTLAGIYLTQAEIDRAVWVDENRHAIARLVERCDDYNTLAAIANLVHYPTLEDKNA